MAESPNFEKLCMGIRENHEEAIKEYYEYFTPRLNMSFSSFIKDYVKYDYYKSAMREERHHLVSKVLTEVIDSIKKDKIDNPNYLRTYIRKALFNQFRYRYKHVKKGADFNDNNKGLTNRLKNPEEILLAKEEEIKKHEKLKTLDRAIQTLTGDQKKIIECFRKRNKGGKIKMTLFFKEMSVKMGKPYQKIKDYYYYALRKIRIKVGSNSNEL